MGVCSTKNATDDGDEVRLTRAKSQRRRLSVKPGHVGDISPVEVVDDDKKNGTSFAFPGAVSETEKKAANSIPLVQRTRKGMVPYNKTKVNQDRAIVKYALQDDPDLVLMGVLDGHGEFGHEVAEFVKERLPVLLNKQENLKKDTPAAMRAAVATLMVELKASSIDFTFSGSTAIFAVKNGGRLFVGNIGDSRCVLARKGKSGEIEALPLSEDNKPENPDEKARILKSGGVVHPLPGAPDEDCGPNRVWLADADVPGLAMSRSIGDEVASTVGVISEPVVVEHTIEKDRDLFAIWASDGVWEFVSNKEACELVWKHGEDLDKAAQELIAESSRRWQEEEDVIDDITCIIAILGNT